MRKMNVTKIATWLKYKKAWENLPPEEAKQLQDEYQDLTARHAQNEIARILPEGQTTIHDTPVEVKVRGDYYWLLINNKDIRAWHKGFVKEYGLDCLAWEMAKSYALTWRSVRG